MISDVCQGLQWESGNVNATHLSPLDQMNSRAHCNSEILLNPRDVHPVINAS